MNKKQAFLIIILSIFDILSKYIIFDNFVMGENYCIIDRLLYIYPTLNTGAAFSIFSNMNILLILISLLILFCLFYYVNKNNLNKLESLSISFIIAGTIGNFYDRLYFSGVRDFISVDLFNFPVFNIADILIVVGAIIYIISMFVGGRNENNL